MSFGNKQHSYRTTKASRRNRAPPPRPEIIASESEYNRSRSTLSSAPSSAQNFTESNSTGSTDEFSQSTAFSQSCAISSSQPRTRSSLTASASCSQKPPSSSSSSIVTCASTVNSHATSGIDSNSGRSNGSGSSDNCPITLHPGVIMGETKLFPRPLDECGHPAKRTCKRHAEYVWAVPRGVDYISLTASGGGGAGGTPLYSGYTAGDVGANQNIVANGAGGQAAAAFIDVPVPVKHGEEVVFYVGAGGNAPSIHQAPFPGVASEVNYAPSIVNQQYKGVEERGCDNNCKFQDQLLHMAGGQVGVLDETQGAPTIVRIRDAKTKRQLRTVLIAEGGLSGNQIVDPAYNGYLISGRYAFTNTFGAPGDVTSSTSGAGVSLPIPAPAGVGSMPSQGGTSIFGPGGIPMITPISDFFSQTTDLSVPIFSYFPNNQHASTDGGTGAGGAGGTNTYAPGRGGDGFIKFTYSVSHADDGEYQSSESDGASHSWTEAR